MQLLVITPLNRAGFNFPWHNQSLLCILDFTAQDPQALPAHEPDTCFFMAGLADLNHLDLNHWFKSRFKSVDFFVKISDLNQYFRFLKNYGQIKAALVT